MIFDNFIFILDFNFIANTHNLLRKLFVMISTKKVDFSQLQLVEVIVMKMHIIKERS